MEKRLNYFDMAEETRRAVISYMESHQSGKDIMDDEVLDAIKGFK